MQEFPIFNCQNTTEVVVVAQRSRTLEQSIQLSVNQSVDFAVTFIARVNVAVGTEYGMQKGQSITDGGELALRAEAGTYPIYTIAWREIWEQGYATVELEKGKQRIPYLFMKSARPEIQNVKYVECTEAALATATAEAGEKSLDAPLSHFAFPRNWLPTSEDIDSDWVLTEDRSTFTEDVVQQYDEPDEMLKRLNEWGRITGHLVRYVHKDSCKFEGVVVLQFQGILYESIEGTEKAFAWHNARDIQQEDVTEQIVENIIGESTTVIWDKFQDQCEPSQLRRRISLRFRQYNAQAIIAITTLEGKTSDQDLYALAIKFGKMIEAKMKADANETQ